jgi:hypothetical protein
MIQIKGTGVAPEGYTLTTFGQYREIKRYVNEMPVGITHYVNLGPELTRPELELMRSSLYTYSRRHGYKVRTSAEKAEVDTTDWQKDDWVLFITKMERES